MRHAKAWLGVGVAFFMAGGSALVQEAATNPVVEIKRSLMYVRIGPGQGVTGLSVNQDGKTLALGFFGGNVEDYFGAAPEALEAARTFRTQRIVGFSLWAVGMTALLADIGYLTYVLVARDSNAFVNNQGVVWGLLIGGAAVGLPGGILMGMSSAKLVEAVNKYNGWLLNRFLPPEQKIDFRMYLGFNQVGVRARF